MKLKAILQVAGTILKAIVPFLRKKNAARDEVLNTLGDTLGNVK